MARKLQPELVALIDAAVKKHFQAEFQQALDTRNPQALLVVAAKALESLKIRETTNHNDGKIVELIQKTSGGSKGQAWCMYFVQTCIGYAELKSGAQSQVYSSGSCESVRNKTPKTVKRVNSADLQPGDALVWRNKRTGLGHTGVFIGWKSPKVMIVIEGNTTGGLVGGEIERDGGGCYLTNRDINGYGDMELAQRLRVF